MRLFILFFILFLASCTPYLHVLEGSSTDKYKSYQCSFHINKDSSLSYIYSRDHNGIYGEYRGKLTRILGDTFEINAKLILGHHYMKTPSYDTFYIRFDSVVAYHIAPLKLSYTDRRVIFYVSGYHPYSKQYILLSKILLNPRLFNSNEGRNYVSLSLSRKNRITGKKVSFRIPYGAAANFWEGDDLSLLVKIKNGALWTIGDPPEITGHIRLVEE
jgi:hypothetical protein